MASHHPDLDFLTEYASGALPLAQSACVTAHLNYCRDCQRLASSLLEVGAAMFERVTPAPVGEALLDNVLARLDEEPPLSYAAASSLPASRMPPILQRLMAGDFSELVWKQITRTLSISYLRTGDPSFELALYHIRAGGRIPEHGHRGSELTLVLQGGFSDADGSYHPGDFIYRRSDEVHAPTALQDEDCICLGVLDAPLKFTQWQYRWLNPFLSLRAG
jgi:putative transcriptional regulator